MILLTVFCSSPVKAQVVINEFLPNSTTEWVEFFNSSPSADYLRAYYLDDDTDFENDGGSGKKLLTDINLSDPRYPYFEISSFLNNTGDFVVLFDSAGNIVDQFEFTYDPGREISIGRYPDKTGRFEILTSQSKGSANFAPVTPAPTETATPTPSPTATDASTPTKTATPTSKATAVPLAKPTPTAPPKNIKTSTPNSDVLSATTSASFSALIDNLPDLTKADNTSDAETDVGGANRVNKTTLVSLVFVVLGAILIFAAIFSAFNTAKSKPNENDI